MKDAYDVRPRRQKIGREFFARRMHSLAGFFFLLFMCEHLFTNSQSALFLGDDGIGFIRAVNWIHSLPYLQVIELTFIALPLAVHIWWGIERIYMARVNSGQSEGIDPSLPYSRNVAFTWQRITSLLLIVAIGLHVYYMRFLKEPESREYGVHSSYFVTVSKDPGLYTLAQRLNFKLIDDKEHEVVVECDNFGLAVLLMVRDTFKSVLFCMLYSFFVLIACFHGCNGLWTFAITWGIVLSERGRNIVRTISNCLMGLLIFFGLASIWGTYWINLRT